MKNKSVLLLAAALTLSIGGISKAHAQAEPDYNSAINLLNLFNKECMAKFPDFGKIREGAQANNWVVGPLGPQGKPVSWAVNEGADNLSLMIVDNISNSSKTCEVRGKASESTTVGVFNGIYADRISAHRTSKPENSWMTSNGLITVQPSDDGRTSVILAK